MVRKEIVQNGSPEITLEVIAREDGLIELSINNDGTPLSILLDKDDRDALIDELAFTKIKFLESKNNKTF